MRKGIGLIPAVLIILFLSFLTSACEAPTASPTPSPIEEPGIPTSTPGPTETEAAEDQSELVVCTSSLPKSLFPYDGLPTPSKNNILAMIQEGAFYWEGGELVADILVKVPNQADGDLRLVPVAVQPGQIVMNAQGELVVLKAGVSVRPSGCRESNCAVLWEGEAPLEMDQMVVDYQLKPGLTWSDGTPVSAADSRFSFQLASDPQAPGLQWAEERTDSYEVLDLQTVRWVGRPGFSTLQLDQFFWTPLPSHLLEGAGGWVDLSQDPRLTQEPLSFGPFMVRSWESDRILLAPNPYYTRRDEGLPYLDEIIYRSLEDGRAAAWAALQNGTCDVLDESFDFENDPGLLAQVAGDEGFELVVKPGGDWIQLVFGIQPAPLSEDEASQFGAPLSLLDDLLTRQGLAACLDRASLVPEGLEGYLTPWQSFLPPSQSQIAPSEGTITDPALGLELLRQAGWVDHDGDPTTPLQAESVTGVPLGTTLSLALITDQMGFHQDLAALIQDSLRACGIEVVIAPMTGEQYYQPGPEGPLFGRRFDLALINWQSPPDLDCVFYLTHQTPSRENNWIGTNIAGFSDRGYDQACIGANLALPQAMASNYLAAEEAYLFNLPAVPLFAPPRISILPSNACDERIYESNQSVFNFIEFYQGDKNCP